jgi:hypothetical protein
LPFRSTAVHRPPFPNSHEDTRLNNALVLHPG